MIITQNMVKDSSLDALISKIYNALLPELLDTPCNKPFTKHSEIVVRCVEQAEMITFNTTYRGKEKVTNVLSFPSTLPADISTSIGDIVICPDVIKKEAKAEHKSYNNHFTHIILHGILHLFGYNHIDTNDAIQMENIEISILQTLGIPNPYE